MTHARCTRSCGTARQGSDTTKKKRYTGAPDERREQTTTTPTAPLAQRASGSLMGTSPLTRSHAYSCCFSFHLANIHGGRADRRRPHRKHTCCNADSPAARYLLNLCRAKSRRRDLVRKQLCQSRVDSIKTQKQDRLEKAEHNDVYLQHGGSLSTIPARPASWPISSQRGTKLTWRQRRT